jgi:hypothetical protein
VPFAQATVYRDRVQGQTRPPFASMPYEEASSYAERWPPLPSFCQRSPPSAEEATLKPVPFAQEATL